MQSVMVRYKVKADRVAENIEYITKVFEQLKREQTADFHYASFRLDDGVSFVHIASTTTKDGSVPLTELSAFKAFAGQIGERCDEPPAQEQLTAVGTYRFFAD